MLMHRQQSPFPAPIYICIPRNLPLRRADPTHEFPYSVRIQTDFNTLSSSCFRLLSCELKMVMRVVLKIGLVFLNNCPENDIEGARELGCKHLVSSGYSKKTKDLGYSDTLTEGLIQTLLSLPSSHCLVPVFQNKKSSSLIFQSHTL